MLKDTIGIAVLGLFLGFFGAIGYMLSQLLASIIAVTVLF